MVKTFYILIFSLFLFVTKSMDNIPQDDRKLADYEKNLNQAAEFYLSEKEIPENILIKLVPTNQDEFGLYYGTTYPDHKLYESNFFYDTSNMIFGQVIYEKNEKFYPLALQLASFADGEYAEWFIENLEGIIALDPPKFCRSAKGKEYLRYNPMKYFYEDLQCEN